MAGGWAKDGAVQDQIDANVADAVERARRELAAGKAQTECVECGADIPQARRNALPGVSRCISCQQEYDANQSDFSPYNRRGSKDSQLR